MNPSESMRVCIVGSGGREHAVAHTCAAAGAEVVVTPGNPGIPWSVRRPVEEVDADLFVIGPEEPLVRGLADHLRSNGRTVFGPGADGARLEGSKSWMKQVVSEAGVPTAAYGSFDDPVRAKRHLATMGDLFVIKTDGLASGKGVLVTDSRSEAEGAVDRYLSGEAFGDAGRTVVIEEGLTGPELSVLVVCDGERGFALSPARDFKRAGDGDTGPNTGGMGAFSPVSDIPVGLEEFVMERAIRPTIHSLRKRDIDYRGVLYAGLMLTPEGPKLLEYNVRFGDPEAQVVLPRMASSLPDLLHQAATGRVTSEPVFSDDSMVTVVCASGGYPTEEPTTQVISGVSAANALDGVTVFAAGVDRSADGDLTTAGGRVLNVTGRGADLRTARRRAYAGVDRIDWPGMMVRRDIASPVDTADPPGGLSES